MLLLFFEEGLGIVFVLFALWLVGGEEGEARCQQISPVSFEHFFGGQAPNR